MVGGEKGSADVEYGTRVAEALGLDVAKVQKLAAMSQDGRVAAK